MTDAIRRFLIVTAISGLLINAFAGSAYAFGPPPHAPTVTCDTISVDPPAVAWIKVTFSGNINGVEFSRSVSYGAPVPHIASADISDLTTATGPLHVSADATWTLGPGTSAVANLTLTCHAAPPVTTEGSPVTMTSTTSTSEPATTSTTAAPARLTQASAPIAPRPSLALTGASTGPLAATGALAVLAGLAAVLGPKRRWDRGR
jgi:hypothetical protein